MSEKPEDRETKTEDGKQPLKDSSRLVLLIAMALVVIVFVVRNMDVSKNILLVMLGFGAVVLVHEFGHFVVAKMCGIKVEAFSIFMPPILLGIKKAERGWHVRILPELLRKAGREGEEGGEGISFTFGRKILPGETEYRVGLLPFGGFVKMLGQEDVGPVKASDDPRSFANKPALVRAAVLAAGVTFNVISAVIVYIVVFLVGINLAAPIVGGVIPGSSAERAGIRPGDEVIEIGGESGRLDFSDVMMAAVLSGKEEVVPMRIRRADGTTEEVNLAAKQQEGGRYREFGIARPMALTVAKLSPESADLLNKTTGLMPGDRIKAVAGIDVNNHWEFERIIDGVFEPNVVLLAERRDASGQARLEEGRLGLEYMEPVHIGREGEEDLSNVCGMAPRMRIAGVSRTFRQRLAERFGPKDKTARLEAGDIIAAAGDIENPTYSELRELTTEYKDKKLPIVVIRSEPNGAQRHLTVETAPRENKDLKRVMIGIAIELDVEDAVVAKAIATPERKSPPAIPRGATITAVDGVAVSSFFDVARELKKRAGQKVTIDWRIDGQNAGDTAIETGSEEKIVTAMAMPKEIVPFKQLERLYKADGPIEAIGMGYKRTKIFIIQAYVTLQRLVGGLVSPKELMGPVGILAFSYRIVADQPLIYYVYFLGLISASLAVLNFMPMPPLDGGLTLLLVIEKIKGSAISVRVQEIIAYVGWGMVGALLLYVTFNDIVRIIVG